MAVDWDNCIYAKDIIHDLKQGDKVKFKSVYNNYESVGRIEIKPKTDVVFFVHEFNYQDDVLTRESIRYYNPLLDQFAFDYFEKI